MKKLVIGALVFSLSLQHFVVTTAAEEMMQEVEGKLHRAQEEAMRAIAASATGQQAPERIRLQLMQQMFRNPSPAASEGETAPDARVRCLIQEIFNTTAAVGVIEKYGESLTVLVRNFETNLRRYDQERKEHFREAIGALTIKADNAANHGNQREAAQLREVVAELKRDDRSARRRVFEALMRMQTLAMEKGLATYGDMLSSIFSLRKQIAERDQAVAVARVRAEMEKSAHVEATRAMLAELTRPRNAILLGGTIVGVYALVRILGCIL